MKHCHKKHRRRHHHHPGHTPWRKHFICEKTFFKPHAHKPVIITNPSSGFVLEVFETGVKLGGFTGVGTQLWALEPADNGRSFIVNKASGNVVELQDGDNLATSAKHGGPNQQWYINSDDTIVSTKDNLAIDVEGGELTVGNKIIAAPKDGRNNQRFQIQYCD